MRGVPRNGGSNVVDHVPNVHGGCRHAGLTLRAILRRCNCERSEAISPPVVDIGGVGFPPGAVDARPSLRPRMAGATLKSGGPSPAGKLLGRLVAQLSTLAGGLPKGRQLRLNAPVSPSNPMTR